MFIVADAKVIDMKEYSFIPQIFIEGLGGWTSWRSLPSAGERQTINQ